jgi:hypothetical protein
VSENIPKVVEQLRWKRQTLLRPTLAVETQTASEIDKPKGYIHYDFSSVSPNKSYANYGGNEAYALFIARQ